MLREGARHFPKLLMSPVTTCDIGLAGADHFSFHDVLRLRARRNPGAPAILAPGRPTLSFARLQAHLDECASRLRAFGIRPDDRVALLVQNGPEVATAILATTSTAIAVPLDPALNPPELLAILARLQPRA